MGPSAKQIALFGELTERKQFPPTADIEALKVQFATLTRKSASDWIDAALALPNVTEADDKGATVPPPFV